MEFIRRIRFESNGDYYYCTFDIPQSLLTCGLGTYNSEDLKNTVQVSEFIMESSKLKAEYLIGYELDHLRESDIKKYNDFQYEFIMNLIKTAKPIKSDNELFSESSKVKEKSDLSKFAKSIKENKKEKLIEIEEERSF